MRAPRLASFPLLIFFVSCMHLDLASSGKPGFAEKVIYAINAGGEAHIDVHGVKYQSDPLQSVGTASDYGKQLVIGRVPENDQILYQTERYHTSTFGYDIPVSEDGWYLLVLKFSEVYFNAPNMKVRTSFIFVFIKIPCRIFICNLP